jgi:DNA-directed RNA polymerase specialized sigma24 family protein
MSARHVFSLPRANNSYEDQVWEDLYNRLRPYVLIWIRAYNLPLWLGQEQEIADDILQETFMRIFKYAKQVETNGNQPIVSLESFSMTIARNCIRDLRRKQYRLVRLTTHSKVRENSQQAISISIDPSELALVHLMSRDTLTILAHIIKDFPPGQRRAILIDLAQHSDFDEETGPLHIIFLELGINLHEYQITRPLNSAERSRHASLLSIAYKRLRQTFCAKTGALIA